jgi:hypothetical protein
MIDEAGMMLLVEPIARSVDDYEREYMPLFPVRPDWQQRVIDEKAELDERIGKLCAFLRSDAYRALPDTDRFLLDRQIGHMRDYAHILFMRVARFG